MNIQDLGLVAIPVIVIICYLICNAVKATQLDNKWLPVIAGFSGGIIGVVAMAVIPEYPANDFITAFAIGVVSGFTATGVNQIAKQFGIKKENKE